MNQRQRMATAGVVFVNIMWGLSFIGSKRSLEAGMQPFSLVAVRFLAATMVLFPLTKLTGGSLKIGKKDVPGLAMSTLLGVTVYFFFELNGLSRLSASTAALIIALTPIFTMILGVLFRHNRPGIPVWAGAAAALLGVYLVSKGDGNADSFIGVLFMLAACMCWVIYGEVTNRLLTRLDCMTVTCWQSLFSLISLLPLMLTEKVEWHALPFDAWMWSTVFLGLICSALCYILYNNSIAQLSPERTALYLNLNPVAAALGSLFILGEEMTLRQVLGGVIILASLFLVNRTPKRETSEEPGSSF